MKVERCETAPGREYLEAAGDVERLEMRACEMKLIEGYNPVRKKTSYQKVIHIYVLF